MVPYLRSANVVPGRLVLDDVKEMNFTPDEQRVFALRRGDVLITEGSGSRETVGAPAVWDDSLPGPVCFQNTLVRLRPGPVLEQRYTYWWARHAHASGLIAEAAGGQSILHIGADTLRDLAVYLPSVGEQRRIADFLDDQVARIDNIITARQQQIDLGREWWDTALASAVRGPNDAEVPLRSQVWWQEGPGILAKEFRESGLPILRISHLRASPPSLDGCQFVDEIDGRARWGHFLTRQGDLIISGSASVGAMAVWIPELLVGAIPYTGLIRVGARSRKLDREYMRFFFMSRVFNDQVERLKQGIGIQHWGPSHLAQVRMPLPDVASQCLRVERLLDLERDLKLAIQGLSRSRDLLAEHRQSLISAAVSGEFDVSTASGRGVPA